MKRTIDIFKEYITGDFTNANQITHQRESGLITHPFAVHINRVANDKIINAPAVDGFWVLEESYYTWEGKETELKPYLFLFEAIGDTAVRLTPFLWPEDLYEVEVVKNDNPDLVFDYRDLKASPTFSPADYRFNGEVFTIFAPNDLGNGLRFTLIETLYPDRLEVMELLEKDSQRLTPYDSPILYERVE
ncbi:MAG TPA: hypothetical protein PKC30_12765 [Saprospiraceae bacterium]|nr:hypothetical protein [Saprospiraceae bacterium]